MLSPSERRIAILRSVGVVMEMLEGRVLLSTTTTPDLPDPIVPIKLPEAPLPLQGVVGTPLSLDPAMINTAYGFNDIGFDVNGVDIQGTGAGTTIAIVDAYGSPTIISDLETFDAHWGLSNNDGEGKFALTIQPLGGAGVTPGPVATNADWAAETSLDVEWAHAVAPGAHILLVESPDASLVHLFDSVVYAADQKGVVAVSMSWGADVNTTNFPTDAPYIYDGYFTTPDGHEDSNGAQGGVTFLASSGDDGTLQYPSASDNVLSVGGLTVSFALDGTVQDIGYWNNAYGSSGGGSDSIYTVPYNVPFVALNADPTTGVWIYDSTPDGDVSGWQVVGGTSFACPAWAGLVAIWDQGLIADGNGSIYSGDLIDNLVTAGETSPGYFFDNYGGTAPTYPIGTAPFPDFKTIPTNGNSGFGLPNTLALADYLLTQFPGTVSTSIFDSSSVADLAFVQGPTNSVAGQAISPSITVDETNGDGNTLSGSVTLSISVLSPSGTPTLLGTTTVAAAGGVATFTDLSIDQAGTYELQATQTGLVSATSSSFVVSAAQPSQLGFNVQPSDAWQFGPVTPAVVVGMEDQFGNVVSNSNAPVTITIQSGPGELSGASSLNAVGGQATFSDLVFSQAGSYTLLATSPNLTSAVSDSFSVIGIPSTRRFLFNGAALGAVLLLQQEHRNASVVANLGPPTSAEIAAAGAAVAAAPAAPSTISPAFAFAADTGASDSLGPAFSFVPVATFGDSDSQQNNDQLNDLLN
jgi:hypothetical protein